MVTTSNIYTITNLITNKKYVGQASNIAERWNRHRIDYKKYTNRYLYRSMNKHGFENFIFEVLEENIPIENIDEREMFWIKELNTKAPNGYNMTDGGEGSFNRIISNETKSKISESLKGKKASDETKLKFSIDRKNRYTDENERRKISISMKSNKEAITKATENIQKVNESRTKEEKRANMEKAIKARSKIVYAQSLSNKNEILQFNSVREATRWIRENTSFIKACHTNISKVCRKKLDYIYGYMWSYEDIFTSEIKGATTIL